jgi:hypothetical protein
VSPAAVVVLVVLALAAFVGDLTWPASGWLAGTTIAYIAVRRSASPWLVAAREVLLPTAIGFGVLTALLLFYNLRYDPGHWISTSAPLAECELRLVGLWKFVSKWDLGGFKMIALLLVLLGVARWRAEWRPVSRMLKVHRAVGRVAAVLATVTSFSFFTNEAVGGRVVDRAVQHLAAHYVGLRDEELVELDRYVATRVVEAAVRELPASSKQYIEATVRRIDAAATADVAAKRQVAWQMGEGYAREWTSGSADWSSLAPAPPLETRAGLEQRLRDDPGNVIEARTVRTELARGLAAAEQSDAFNRMASSVLDVVDEGLIAILESFLGPTIDLQASLLADKARHYFKAVADGHLEEAIRPQVSRIVTGIQSGVRRKTEDGRSPAGAAEVAVENVLAAHGMSQERKTREVEEPPPALAREPRVEGGPGREQLDVLVPETERAFPRLGRIVEGPSLNGFSHLSPSEQARASVVDIFRRQREARELRDILGRPLGQYWRRPGRPIIRDRPRYRPRPSR